MAVGVASVAVPVTAAVFPATKKTLQHEVEANAKQGNG
jgi:hypothetical protein